MLNVVSKINKASDTFGCISKITAALKIIISDPSIKEVILASRGPLYTTSNGFGGVENYGEWVLHYENEEQGIRSNPEVFFGALGTTFDVLTSAGKKVTYLIDVPELGFDIKSCLSLRPITITAKVKEPCAILRSEYDDRTRDFRERLAIVLESRPSVNVVDLSKALCDDKYCYGSKDGALLYTDDDHLSHRGSEYVVHRLWGKFR